MQTNFQKNYLESLSIYFTNAAKQKRKKNTEYQVADGKAKKNKQKSEKTI